MVRIDKKDWVHFLIGLLEQRHQENPSIVCADLVARMVRARVYGRISNALIWEEKLELVPVVEGLYQKGLEVKQG